MEVRQKEIQHMCLIRKTKKWEQVIFKTIM